MRASLPPASRACSDLVEVDAEHYTAVLETKVAYLAFKFKIAVEVVRTDPPREIEAKIEGTPLGIVGRLTASSVTRLAEQNGGTKVSYEVDAALTGKLGSLGQPVLRSKAKEMERQFAERMRAAFAGASLGAGAMTPFELAGPGSLPRGDRACSIPTTPRCGRSPAAPP